MSVPTIVCDSNDSSSLLSMASQARLVLNCVGPYRFYGESVVEACVEAGAHHLDISGEPQYLEKMQLKYHQVGTSFIMRGMALMINVTESCREWCLRGGSLWIRLHSCRPRSDLCQEGHGGRRQLSGDLPRGPGSRPSWCCNQLCHLPGFIGSMNLHQFYL